VRGGENKKEENSNKECLGGGDKGTNAKKSRGKKTLGNPFLGPQSVTMNTTGLQCLKGGTQMGKTIMYSCLVGVAETKKSQEKGGGVGVVKRGENGKGGRGNRDRSLGGLAGDPVGNKKNQRSGWKVTGEGENHKPGRSEVGTICGQTTYGEREKKKGSGKTGKSRNKSSEKKKSHLSCLTTQRGVRDKGSVWWGKQKKFKLHE